MLDTLDIVIGFSLVMLVMSMAVTMLTQLIGTAILNMRGRALRSGLARLLALLDRGLTPAEAERIADHLLRNPLIAPPAVLTGGHRLAPVVHRAELVKLILDFAVAGDADRASDNEVADEEALRDKIRRSLAGNGIADPAAVLVAVRNAVLEQERTSPELSHGMRLNIAILNAASSEFLSKVNSWFDQTIDRVSDLFTARIRLVTAGVAIMLAFFLQLDSISLLNRLSVDDALRDRLVAAAVERAQGPAPAAAAPAPQQGQTAVPAPGNLQEALRASGVDQLEQFGILSLPVSWQDWMRGWDTSAPGSDLPLRIFGILLTAALLSLGAPFWYSALRDLVRLRSVVARKDDAERAERQSTQVPAVAVAVRDGDGGG